MSPNEMAILLWLSCCGSALWRYSSNSPNYHIFSTRSIITLEYEGTTFSKWSVPKFCHIQDENLPKTKLRCSSPGVHRIKPVVTGIDTEEERYLHVDNSDVCFLWYYKVTNLYHNLSQSLIIWIYDPENSQLDELIGNATSPSMNSIVLSRQFATLGQKPTVYTFFQNEVYTSQEDIAHGVWYVNVSTTKEDMIKEIKGYAVAFQDCFVADIPALITFPSVLYPSDSAYLPLSSPAGSQLISSFSACTPSFAVVVTDVETFQTNNSFRTWIKIRAPPNMLSDDDRHKVTGVTLVNKGLYLLINGVLYLKSQTTFKRIGKNKKLPEGGIIGLTTRRWCWDKFILKTQRRRSILAVWTEHEIYLGYSLSYFVKVVTTTELKTILNLPTTATLTIHTLEFTGHPLEFTVFLNYCITCTATRNIYVATFNEDLQEWVFQDFTLEIPSGSLLSARFLYSAMPSLILWDNHKLYYCYQNFTINGVIRTTTGEENLSTLSDGSNIHDVFADYYGNVVAKMENNVMFYFKINIKDAIKLHLWVNEKAKSLFFINISAQVYFVHILDDNTIKAEEYPLQLEIQSAIHNVIEKCPYTAFHNNILYNFYILDKGENLTVWAKIIYPENVGLSLLLEFYGPKIFQWKQRIQYEIALGYCTKTLELTFFQDVNYQQTNDYPKLVKEKMGLVLFQLRPSEYSKKCPKAQKVFQLTAGCDGSKYIEVKGFSKKGCMLHDFFYIIEKSYLRDRPSKNRRVKYDWIKYGCPLRLDYQEKFYPIIQLFDANGFIEEIKVNFIVWEIHGRDDYSFTNTMQQSGCLNEAQTWKKMIQLKKNASLENVWGPENYIPCFSYAIGKPGDLNQPYEIINSSNNNSLYWPSGHSGMYVFSVKILDPNYSFCNLQAIFAIETYGMIPRPSIYLVTAVLLVLMLLVFTILVLSYFKYMKIYRQYIYEPLNKPQGMRNGS